MWKWQDVVQAWDMVGKKQFFSLVLGFVVFALNSNVTYKEPKVQGSVMFAFFSYHH